MTTTTIVATPKSDIPAVGSRSPWGKIQTVQRHGKGIATVTTSRHGGIKLSPENNRKVHPAWRRAGGWYEEDQEYAIVVLTFPDAIPGLVEWAHESAKNNYPSEYGAVYGCTVRPEESRALRLEMAREAARGKFQVTARWGSWADWVPEGFVGVFARVDGSAGPEGSPEGYFLMPESDNAQEINTIWVIDPTRHAAAPCGENGRPLPIK